MGGTGEVKVKFEAVSGVEGRIATTLKKLEARLQQLEGELNPIHNSWTGDAKAAYAADKAKWDQASQDMNTVLAQLRKAVSDAHETYVQVNNKTKAMFT